MSVTEYIDPPTLVSIKAKFQCQECGLFFETNLDTSADGELYELALDSLAALNDADMYPQEPDRVSSYRKAVCEPCARKLHASLHTTHKGEQ